MTLKAGDMVKAISFSVLFDMRDKVQKKRIAISEPIEVIKAGPKAFETSTGRRYKHEDLRKILDGVFRDHKVIVIPAEEDPAPYVQTAKEFIDSAIIRGIEHHKKMLDMLNEMTSVDFNVIDKAD